MRSTSTFRGAAFFAPWRSEIKEVLGGLRRIAVSGAWLEIIMGIDEIRDTAEVARLELPPLTEEYVRST